MSRRKSRPLRSLGKLALYVTVALIAFWTLGPIYVTVVSSLSYDSDLTSVPPPWIPLRPTLEHYEQVFSPLFNPGGLAATTADRVLPALRNSSIIAVSIVALNIVIGGLAGFAVTWLRFRFKSLFVGFILMTIYVPAFPLIYPFFVTFQTLHLLDTHLAVILAQNAFILPFSVWLLSGYFEAVPADIVDAAAVDGCTVFQTFYKIVLRLSLPGIFAAAVFSFMLSWNDFLFPLLLTNSLAAMGITPVIAGFLQDFRIQYGLISASTLLAAVVPVLLVLIAQSFLVKGLMRGAVKG